MTRVSRLVSAVPGKQKESDVAACVFCAPRENVEIHRATVHRVGLTPGNEGMVSQSVLTEQPSA
jgi:hypothetical protein